MNKKLLLISDVLYLKRSFGSENRIYSMVSFLGKNGFDITFFYVGNDADIFMYEAQNIIYNKTQISLKSKIKRTIGNTFFWKILKAIKQKIKGQQINDLSLPNHIKNIYYLRNYLKINDNFDVVLFEYISMSYLFETVKIYTKAKTIIDTHDIMYKRYKKIREFNNNASVLKITKEEEMAILSKFDKVLAIQNEEYKELKDEIGEGKVILAMHGIEDDIFENFKYKARDSQKLNIIFFGSPASFNADSIDWFIQNVWDEELKEKFELHIFGGVCSELKNLPKEVVLHGKVPEIIEVYHNADISINPIRFGSGLKIKNVEAMAYGIPLITTDIGIQGMDGISANELIVANDPKEFKDALVKLLDTDERRKLSGNSKRYAKEIFSQSSCFRELLEIMG